MLQNIPLISLNQRPDELKSQSAKNLPVNHTRLSDINIVSKKLHIQLAHELHDCCWALISDVVELVPQ